MVTILGGTFSHLHEGHRTLLEVANAIGKKIVIGLSTNEFASRNKAYTPPTYDERKAVLESFLSSIHANFEIVPLNSKFGGATRGSDYETIVVSEETVATARAINSVRMGEGLPPLDIVSVPTIRADDLIAVRSSRIFAGAIDESGKRLTPVKVVVSTSNHLKVASTEKFLSRLLKNVTVQPNRDYRTEMEQPFGDDTVRMARIRAESVREPCDYAIGIESGIFFEHQSSKYVDFHCCYVIDSVGEKSIGFSSGFLLPDDLVAEIKKGYDMTEAFSHIHNIKRIGEREGIAGFYSSGLLTREDLITESLRNAFSQRTRKVYKN